MYYVLTPDGPSIYIHKEEMRGYIGGYNLIIFDKRNFLLNPYPLPIDGLLYQLVNGVNSNSLQQHDT